MGLHRPCAYQGDIVHHLAPGYLKFCSPKWVRVLGFRDSVQGFGFRLLGLRIFGVVRYMFGKYNELFMASV